MTLLISTAFVLALLSLAASPAQAEPPAVDRVSVPAGSFTQGDAALPDAPPRVVVLSAYDIARTEVSVADFEAFTAAGGYRRAELWSDEGRAWLSEHPEGAGEVQRAAGRPSTHPVVAVSFWEAEAWCAWAGGRLPTEAQWEHAACGEGGRRYPWGDDEAVAATWYDGGKFGHLDRVRTAPVDQVEPATAGPHGLAHAAGNVWEWTLDRYHQQAWQAGQRAVDPTGPTTGPWRTLRGGSFMNLPSYCTCGHREPARPERVAYTTGFRCVWDPQ